MTRVSQEFYCGECSHYFLVNLNLNLNYEVEIVCPNEKCKHKHRRCIKDGIIYESGRFQTDVKEEIVPMRSTLSKKPLTSKMQEAHKRNGSRRDGVPRFDRWLEVAARERGEID